VRLPRNGAPDFVLVAALSASLADVGELPPAAQAGDDARAVTTGDYAGLCIRSTRTARPAPGEPGQAVEVLVVRYLLQTPFGGLALAFSASAPDFHDVLEPLFAGIAETVRLDPWRPAI
jgi:hypothetical protein